MDDCVGCLANYTQYPASAYTSMHLFLCFLFHFSVQKFRILILFILFNCFVFRVCSELWMQIWMGRSLSMNSYRYSLRPKKVNQLSARMYQLQCFVVGGDVSLNIHSL